jgi:TPP-dependent pyruvate/acetoin dehydrogenase alpha subunit
MKASSLSRKELLQMYHTMQLIRRFETRVNELYLQGKIPSTLHLYIGQEAVATGACAHLQDSDYLLSTHRPHGHAIAKGVSINSIMAELFGKATGCCKGKGGSMHVGDISVGMFPAIAIVGGNTPIAAGAALAQKMNKTKGVTVCFSGDGAANEGAWHESLNAAAIYDLPTIFIVENNLYAASTPFNFSFKVDNVADRACAYGIPGVIVDGNDVLAVYEAVGEAVKRARSGEGPTLVECKTYRQCGHSRSDPRTYRTKEEEAEWLKKDPIPRHRKFLLSLDDVSEKDLVEIDAQIEADIETAIAFAEESPEPDPAETYTEIFI